MRQLYILYTNKPYFFKKYIIRVVYYVYTEIKTNNRESIINYTLG